MSQRTEAYKRLKADINYTDVRFDADTGGLRATHILHIFHPKRGLYEDDVADILVRNGDMIILGKEKEPPGKPPIPGLKHADGEYNGQTCEIASVTGTRHNGLVRALKHCRSKSAEIAIIHFAAAGTYTEQAVQRAVVRYNVLGRHRFKQIVVVADGKAYKISHP